ncbi:olfactory receptor 1E16-like [Gastrophryne carolinensis]
MRNSTKITAFILLGLSDNPVTMNGLFVLFLPIYLMTVITNLLIFFLILTDSRLHNPMYFFLANLAFLDMSYSSVTAPRMLFNLIINSRTMTIRACMAQVFFFLFFVTSEHFLLSAMSYDRYIAICHPLRYTQIMSSGVCIRMASLVWVLGCMCSLMHTLFSLRLSFCGPNVIYNFFCDLPHLFQITCTDTFINIIVILIAGSVGVIGAILLIFLPYVYIFSSILRIHTKTGKLKAFSTCGSHLTVVLIFYGSVIFIYMVPTTLSMLTMNKVFSVIYALINPLINPLIYSLRNKDLKAALVRSLFIHLGCPAV